MISRISIIPWPSKFTSTISYIEMDMDTTGMGMLVVSVYIRYGAVLFKGAVQLKLFPETKIKPFE